MVRVLKRLEPQDVETILRLEDMLYPEYMGVLDAEDLRPRRKAKALLADDGYLLIHRRYVVDFAAATPTTAMALLAELFRLKGRKKLSAHCRVSTSLRLLESAERRGYVEILKRKKGEDWVEESTVFVEFRILGVPRRLK